MTCYDLFLAEFEPTMAEHLAGPLCSPQPIFFGHGTSGPMARMARILLALLALVVLRCGTAHGSPLLDLFRSNNEYIYIYTYYMNIYNIYIYM